MNRFAIVALLLIPLPSLADDDGFYGGAGLTYSFVNVGDSLVSIEDQSAGFRVLVGYQFVDMSLPLDAGLAVEGGYVDFGEFSEVTTTVPVLQLDTEINGFELYARITIPFADHWRGYAKLGAIIWDAELRSTDASGTVTGSADDIDAAAALGIARNLAGPWTVAAEWAGYNFADGLSVLSVSAVYRFK